jgi:hypothetical protein
LFNYQAHFRFSAERLFVNVQNARSKQDVEVLVEAMVLGAQCLVDPEAITRFNFQAASHAIFDVKGDGNAFFQAFMDPSNHVVGGGKIITVQQPDWNTSVRLSVEKSVAVQDGAFLAWATEQTGAVDLEALNAIADRFSVSARSIGLEYRLE